MIERFSKNAILLFSFAVPVIVLNSFGIQNLIAIPVSCLIFAAAFLHQRFVSHSYWQGMLLPVSAIVFATGGLMLVGLASEGSDDTAIPIFSVLMIPMLFFYLWRLAFGVRSSKSDEVPSNEA